MWTSDDGEAEYTAGPQSEEIHGETEKDCEKEENQRMRMYTFYFWTECMMYDVEICCDRQLVATFTASPIRQNVKRHETTCMGL